MKDAFLLKKILFLFVLLCSPFLLGAQDLTYTDVTSEFLNSSQPQSQTISENQKKDVNTSKENSSPESLQSNLSTENLSKQKVSSMTALELCNELILQTDSLLNQIEISKQQVLISKQSQENLLSELTITKSKLKNLELDCQRLKVALISNKEDTSVVIKEISEVQQELENLQELISFYKKEVKRRITKGNFFLPLSFISGISLATGSFLIYKGVTTDNNTLATSGYILTGGGAIGFFTLQFTWRIE